MGSHVFANYETPLYLFFVFMGFLKYYFARIYRLYFFVALEIVAISF